MKNTLLGIALAALALGAAPQARGQASRRAQGGAASGKTAAPKQIDAGRYEGGRYVNDFFGLTFTPPGWVAASTAQTAELMESTKAAATSDDKRQEARLQGSIERSRILLAMTKLPRGMPANASLMLVAERIPTPDVKRPADVLRRVEEGFKGTPFRVEVESTSPGERIGGAEFAAASIKTTTPYGVFRQKIYVTLRKGYSLQFTLTHLDDSDLATFEEAMRTVVIK